MGPISSDLNLVQKTFRWILLGLFTGVAAGFSAYLLLTTLTWANNIHDQYPQWVWFLPLAGLTIGFVSYFLGSKVSDGYHLVIQEVHRPKDGISLWMAPFILISTFLTHLLGGSAGRESAVVQLGASLSDQLSRLIQPFHHLKLGNRIDPQERSILLVAAAGSAFGAAMGAPWAGICFGIESTQFLKSSNLTKKTLGVTLLVSAFSAWVSTSITRWLHAPHSVFSWDQTNEFNFLATLFWVGFAGVVFGLASSVFAFSVKFVEKVFSKIFPFPPLRPMAGGVLLAILFTVEGSLRYRGLGISTIQEAFYLSLTPAMSFAEALKDPLFKGFFSVLTLGTGFKGGEFFPLVFIGSTLGSALSIFIPVSFNLLVGVGFVAVFAGASRTPFTCTLLAIQLFGWRMAPYALVACFVSWLVSSKLSKSSRLDLYLKREIGQSKNTAVTEDL